MDCGFIIDSVDFLGDHFRYLKKYIFFIHIKSTFFFLMAPCCRVMLWFLRAKTHKAISVSCPNMSRIDISKNPLFHFIFLRAHQWHMEVPRPGTESKLKLQQYHCGAQAGDWTHTCAATWATAVGFFFFFFFFFFFGVFLPFLGLFPRHIEVPRLGV